LRATVDLSVIAGIAISVVDDWLDTYSFTGLESFDPVSNFFDNTAEFVT
jgi:hypothetical protein